MRALYLSSVLIAVSLIISCESDENKQVKKSSVDLSSGLVAYYPFNGNTNDESGNRYHGSIVNEVIFTNDQQGNSQHACQFDGLDDYIVTSTEIDDHLDQGATFCARIKMDNLSTPGRILTSYDGTGTPGDCIERIGFILAIKGSNNQIMIAYNVDGDNHIGRVTEIDGLDANVWYNVVATWDGTFSSSGFSIYVDGVREDVEDHASGVVNCGYLESNNPFHIGIGHCAYGLCAPFDGVIDEVRIYDRPLNFDEINALM